MEMKERNKDNTTQSSSDLLQHEASHNKHRAFYDICAYINAFCDWLDTTDLEEHSLIRRHGLRSDLGFRRTNQPSPHRLSTWFGIQRQYHGGFDDCTSRAYMPLVNGCVKDLHPLLVVLFGAMIEELEEENGAWGKDADRNVLRLRIFETYSRATYFAELKPVNFVKKVPEISSDSEGESESDGSLEEESEGSSSDDEGRDYENGEGNATEEPNDDE